MKKVGLVMLILVLFTGFAFAQSQSVVTVVNDTGYLGIALFISPSSSSEAGDDLLGNDLLEDGEAVEVNLAAIYGNHSHYDFIMVDLDGDAYVKANIDIRTTNTVIFEFWDIVWDW